MAPATLLAGGGLRTEAARRRERLAKPFKFALSLAIHFVTFAASPCLPEDERSDMDRVTAAVSSAAGVSELAYIVFSGARSAFAFQHQHAG